MISLRQLRYFVALAEQRHFGRAAEQCFVSQPALSTQIQELEADIGVELVERRRGAVTLTPLGQEVAARAVRILGEVGDLHDLARSGRTLLSGVLRLGVIPTIAPYLLPKVLPRLGARYPALNLVLEERRTDTLVSELIAGEIDVALLSLPIDDDSLESHALFDDPFLLAEPAAGVQSSETLLLLDEGHCLRDQALRYCELADFGARRQFGLASLSTVVQMVAAGYGATLLPAMAVEREVLRNDQVRVAALPDPAPSRKIGLVWRRTSPRKADFIALGEVILEARADAGAPALPRARAL